MPTIYFVRHGRTAFNRQNRWMGRTDEPLDDVGVRQADALARKMVGVSFDRIYSSPLKRARQTAERIALGQTAVGVELSELLSERGFGVLEGVEKRLVADRDLDQFLGVESRDSVETRLRAFLSDVPRSGNILVVSHSAVYRTFSVLGCLVGRDAPAVLGNGEVAVFSFEPRV